MPEEKKQNGLISSLLGAVKLDWLRPLIYKVGGRKMVVGGGALAIIDRITQSAGEALTWAHATTCLAVAIVAAAVALATAWEDKGEKAAKLFAAAKVK